MTLNYYTQNHDEDGYEKKSINSIKNYNDTGSKQEEIKDKKSEYLIKIEDSVVQKK